MAARRRIGEDVVETLEFEQPKVASAADAIPKLACPQAPECGVAQPPRPKGLVEANRYDTSVAAQIIAAKYALHLPVYRHQDQFAGSGWTPSRSTLLNIMAAAAELARPLYEHYHRLVLSNAVIGTDDTTVTLILPPETPPPSADDPRTQRLHEVCTTARAGVSGQRVGHMWAYRAATRPVNLFDFTVSHHRDGPDEMLRGYNGVLLADCYTGYQNIELRSDWRIPPGRLLEPRAAKVFDARDNQPLEAAVLLAMIGQLYNVEDRGKTLSPEERTATARREARPVLERIRNWLDGEAATRSCPRVCWARPCDISQSLGGVAGLPDRRPHPDRQQRHRAIDEAGGVGEQKLAVHRQRRGRRSGAALLTLVSTAHRNDLDIWAYLKDVLDRLLAGETGYRSLQADVWKQTHPEQIRTYRPRSVATARTPSHSAGIRQS